MEENAAREESRGRQRIRSRPPERLAWPGGRESNGTEATNDTAPQKLSNNSGILPRRGQKKSLKRKLSFVRHDSNNNHQEANLLWSTKYEPSDCAMLAVAPKKVKEVMSWLEGANLETSRMLILIGSPGIGKSTMVRCIAKDCNFNLVEWIEKFSSQPGTTMSASPLSMDYESSLDCFESFLNANRTGLNSLSVTGMHKSRNGKRKRDCIAEESERQTVVLLDNLPNLHDNEAIDRFRQKFTNHILCTAIPLVWIYSDVVEGKHQPSELEKLVEADVLYSASVKILQINPPTRPKFKKAIELVARQEHFNVSPVVLDALYDQTGGDIRSALSTLQFERIGLQTAHRSHHQANEAITSNEIKDHKLTMFHALGKILYAKRTEGHSQSNEANSIWEDGRPPLEFVPEQVMEFSQLELSGSLQFLGYHCVDFFTDVNELSLALSDLSDAAYLLDQCPPVREFESIYPHSYVRSIGGRAIANANKHPAPTKFRQLSAPRVFQVIRGRRENVGHLRSLVHRLSVSEECRMDCAIEDPMQYTVSRLSYIRIIRPELTQLTISQMQSLIGEARKNADHFAINIQDEEEKAREREQAEILEEDDIQEFSDDGSTV